ncbi:MAG TPA: VWA domain-containing protein [Gammaproteobacteria bacterium]|nr:VWA domain-containing protein [Gammaproteobacteria bacterium]
MPASADQRHGRLPENILHFGRVLRSAGLPVGTGRIIDALRAVDCIGIDRRADLHAALSAVFIDRHEQQALFDQAFHVFWRDPKLLQRMLGLLLARAPSGAIQTGPQLVRRLAEALAPGELNDSGQGERIEVEASPTWSDQEQLQHRDFESMSVAELAAARAAIARMRLGLDQLPVRRFRPDPHGVQPDPRATLRALRSGRDSIDLLYRTRRTRPPTVVILCDISGSMSQYARIFLQFAHALTAQRPDVHTLLFGTRLTDVTRQLRGHDPDAALAAVGARVSDWSGGTRIGQALAEFNRRHARRLLAQGAVVLLMSDGLDRDAGAGIESEIRRLHRLARRLIWLNPLLRYEGFEARAAGVRALLPHVDEFRPIHNLHNLEQLAAVLAGRSTATGERHDLRRTARRR